MKIAALGAAVAMAWAAPAARAQESPDAEFDRLLGQKEAARKDHALLLSQAAHPDALIFPEDRDPADIVLRRTRALLECLRTRHGGRDWSAEEDALRALGAEGGKVPVADAAARRDLFARAVRLRRRIAFSNPLLEGLDRLLVVKRELSRYDHMCDQFYGHTAVPAGGLFVLERPFSDRPVVRNLLENSACGTGRLKGRKLEKGAFLTPDVSFDGKRILFAFTEADLEGTPYNGEAGKWAPKCTYHLFRVNADGTGLVQLTDGAWNEFDPCWLPSGRIAFVSERRGGYLRCSGFRPCPNYTLHTMDDDGGDIVCISPHETNEWGPSVDSSGMLLYTRWDYVDRGALQAHHPWKITPDGRDARAIHGNYPARIQDRPQLEAGLRAIPGSIKVVAVAAPHHGQFFGSLVLLDPNVPDDDRMSQLRRITPYARFNEVEVGAGEHWYYATPWPLGEEFFLCVYSPAARKGRYGVYLVDVFGNQELIHRDLAVSCWAPMPLRPRPAPPAIPHVSAVGVPKAPPAAGPPAERPRTAAMAVMDVTRSRLPFPPGVKIRGLRVIQVLPKTTPVHHAPQIGYGCETSARAVLGTVPVEEDGSAYFAVPPGKGVYFQALDADGLAVQSMRSETWAQPGETLTCQGCHEERSRAPSVGNALPLAMRRAPSAIRPEVDGSNPFSFPRLVQPVLDRHCADCHRKEAARRAPALDRGDWEKDGFRWFASYRNLRPYAFHYGRQAYGMGDYDAWTTPRSVPGKTGARASRLYELLSKGHYDLKMPPEDLRRLTLWLDCNSDFFGAYEEIETQARGGIVKPALE